MGKKRQIPHSEFQIVYIDTCPRREGRVSLPSWGAGPLVTSFQEVEYGNGGAEGVTSRRSLTNTTSARWSRPAVRHEARWRMYPCYAVMKRVLYPVVFLLITYNSSLSMRKTSKPSCVASYKTPDEYPSGLSTSSKLSLRNSHSQELPRDEAVKLTWHPGWDLGTEKGHPSGEN